MSKAKRNALILVTVTAMLTLLLAMSLRALVLAPGQPFALDETPPPLLANNVPLVNSEVMLWVLRGFVAVVVIFLPVYIIYSLRTPEGRRRLILNVIMLLALLWITDQLQKQMLQQAAEQTATMMNTPDRLPSDASIPVAIFPNEPPAWVTLVVIAIASLLVAGVIFSLIMMYRRRAEPEGLVFDKLAEAAQNTIQSLHEGGDFKLSIIQCYREMSRVIREEKGIARDQAMTPREFESVLINRGLPSTSVDTLTRLFEQVRYGSLETAPGEQDLAIACLTEIVQVCRPESGLREG